MKVQTVTPMQFLSTLVSEESFINDYQKESGKIKIELAEKPKHFLLTMSEFGDNELDDKQFEVEAPDICFKFWNACDSSVKQSFESIVYWMDSHLTNTIFREDSNEITIYFHIHEEIPISD